MKERRNQRCKRPGRQKSRCVGFDPVITSGEDPKEFEELYSALIEEWAPTGASENDAVFGLATAMWGKRRAQQFRSVQLLTNTLDVNHPAFDELVGLQFFTLQLQRHPETAFDLWSGRLLRPDKIKYLNQKFPRSRFTLTSQWVKAIVNEIRAVLAPEALPPPPKLPGEVHELMTKAHEFTEQLAALRSATLSRDLFDDELAMTERFDAIIDRLIKRLIHLKVTKQMLG